MDGILVFCVVAELERSSCTQGRGDTAAAHSNQHAGAPEAHRHYLVLIWSGSPDQRSTSAVSIPSW